VSLARDHRLRKQAAALLECGIDVSVICRRDPQNASVGGVTVLEYPAPKDGERLPAYVREYLYSGLMAVLLTARALVRPGFDVVQMCGAPDIYFPIARVLRLLGKRVVYDQRDPSPETHVARYGSGPSVARRLLGLFERWTFAVADHVFVVNQSLRDRAVSRGGVPASRVTVVGNGPVLARVHRRADADQLKHGRPLMCLWHGMMGVQDHVDIALRVFDRLVRDYGRADCLLVLAGDGETREASERLAADLGIGAHVQFTGWLEEEDVFRLLSAADVAIEPNLESFVSPVKVLECMAFGVPIVAFDLDETRRMAGPSAVYAPPGDEAAMARALACTLDDAAKRKAMAEEGIERVRADLAWDRQKESYVAVIQRLLGVPEREEQIARPLP
jgi:glycosyltransferase involved in cell wall biosynthesis